MKIARRQVALDSPMPGGWRNGLRCDDQGVEYFVSESRVFLYPEDERRLAVALFDRCRVNLARLDDLFEAAAARNGAEVRAHILQLVREGKDKEAGLLARSIEAQLLLLPMASQGLQHGSDQAKRRKNKPGRDLLTQPSNRNEMIRQFHARLKAGGEHDATSQTAVEFNLHTRTIQRILKAPEL